MSNILHNLDGFLLRLLDIETDIISLKSSLIQTRLELTDPTRPIIASSTHPDLMDMFEQFESIEDAETTCNTGHGIDYSINKDGKKVYVDHH